MKLRESECNEMREVARSEANDVPEIACDAEVPTVDGA